VGCRGESLTPRIAEFEEKGAEFTHREKSLLGEFGLTGKDMRKREADVKT